MPSKKKNGKKVAKKSSKKAAATKKSVKKAAAKKSVKKSSAGPKAASAKTAAKKSSPPKKTGKPVAKASAKKPARKKTPSSSKTPRTRKVVVPAAAPQPKIARFTIDATDATQRIDRFLGEKMENASRTRIQKWMESGAVLLNGEPVRKSRSLAAGDSIEVTVPVERSGGRAEPENIPLKIVYEDKHLAVVDKPKGLVTHPGHGVPGGTLANALAYRYKALSDFGGVDRPGIVHRLDRDTSGLLVIARDNATHAALSADLAARKIRRTYRAIIWREPPPEGTFDWPLGRHPKDPTRRAVWSAPDAKAGIKAAITHYRVLQWFQFAAEVEVTLDTGRTHQIRVHFSHAGYPVAGDTPYGGGEAMLSRVPPLFQSAAAGLAKRLSSQALHAAKLSFVHPRTKKTMTFESPVPEEYAAALKGLEKFRREPD
jgi:23S rRNA pseudouridine1911/1915/1917 synthase